MKEKIKMKQDLKKINDIKNKKKIPSKNDTNIKSDYVLKKAVRMSKAEDIIYSSSPFVLALIVQLMSSLVGMFIFSIYKSIQLEPGINIAQISLAEYINTPLTLDASLVISAFSAIICIIVFYRWYTRQMKNECNSIVKVKMKLKHVLLLILLGIGLQVGISFLMNLIAMVKPNLFNNYGLILEQLGGGTTIVSFIYIGIIAPISEELIFRGVLLNKAKVVLPIFWANVLQGFLFGLYHMNIIQGIYAFIIGMFLGSICIGLKSIYAAVVLHVIINLCGLLLGQMTINEQYQTPLVFSGIIIISIIGIIFSMIILKKDYTHEE